MNQKLSKLDDKKILNERLDYENLAEKQKLLDQKQNLKNLQLDDLDNYNKKKQVLKI